MAKNVKISRGVDIKLVGEAKKELGSIESATAALKPADFHGVIPKMELKQGDEVKAGTPLFHDKNNNNVKFVSPVSGEVAKIVRGAKRRILEVRVLADKETKFESYDVSKIDTKEAVVELLQSSGQWAFIKQRPFDVIADATQEPKAIFISAFDSAPLAPDYNFVLKDRAKDLQAGVDALDTLTSGAVNIVTRGDKGVFGSLNNCTLHSINGPHPAGNVGVQVHHIDPINKGEVVWSVNACDLAAIGHFLNNGKIENTRTVALSGAEAKSAQYYTVTLGGSAENIVKSHANEGARVISGNVLTGEQISAEGYLGYYSHHITAIREDKEPEFFGWLAPGFDKFSLSKTFFSWAMPSKNYNLGTSLHGEERSFVMSGQYEKVFPFDILPVQLLKSIMVSDIEQMENLGIYEVAPEDFALCEFACTSKINSQEIVRNGLDLIKKELS